jgi:pantetheine-phosphate adenylyltransferase
VNVTRAVCPGSYDPVTLGHLDVIRRAAILFDEVIVAVVRRPKHKQPLFEIDDRIAFLEDSCRDLPNVRVEAFSSLITSFARERGATALVKGLRAVSDFEWEFQMNHLNKRLAPDIETVYLMASAGYSFISSSGVKEIASFGGAVDDLVPELVAERFRQLVPVATP